CHPSIRLQCRHQWSLIARRGYQTTSPRRQEFLREQAQALAARTNLGQVWDRATVDPATRDRDSPTNQLLKAAVSNFASSRQPRPRELQKLRAPFGYRSYAENFRDL